MTQTTAEQKPGAREGRIVRRVGTVVSDKGEKSIRVRFQFTVKHPMYGRYVRRSTTLHAHDEKNEARMGDLVEVAGCRRISKTKSWRLARILKQADTEGS